METYGTPVLIILLYSSLYLFALYKQAKEEVQELRIQLNAQKETTEAQELRIQLKSAQRETAEAMKALLIVKAPKEG